MVPIKLFGFQLTRPDNETQANNQTFIPPTNDDGALTISSASHYGTYVDLDGSSKNEVELITRYREMSMQPEIESAIDDIVDEAIVQDEDGKTIEIVLDNVRSVSNDIKKKITAEFDTVMKLMNYNKMAQEVFRRWYVDGRIFYHVIIDRENPSSGIQELRYVDPRKIKKVRELRKDKDDKSGTDVVNVVNEYYVYNDKVQTSGSAGSSSLPGIKIAKDSIINVNSGLMDAKRASVLSYLHKAIKPLNQLRMVEDATVIYRISRAPERRIFYIDVGNLPKLKAEQYLNDMMAKYKNKIVYDSATGQIRDDRKNLSMLEDFWLPRREGGKGTEITTLQGGENLGVLEDVIYFEKKLYKSLCVPVARLNPSEGFSLGRSTEITRDELKFNKFVERLRSRFTDIFDQALRVQLSLKGICTIDEWEEIKEKVHYNFCRDNYFTELKEAEVMKERVMLVQLLDPYTGRYYSEEWIRKKVLRLDDDEIKEMDAQIRKEGSDKDLASASGTGVNASNPDKNGMSSAGGDPGQPEDIDPEDHDLNNQVRNFKL